MPLQLHWNFKDWLSLDYFITPHLKITTNNLLNLSIQQIIFAWGLIFKAYKIVFIIKPQCIFTN